MLVIAEKSLRVKSEWMVHQAHCARLARSSPALVPVSHYQLYIYCTSSSSFVDLPLVRNAIDASVRRGDGGRRSENWLIRVNRRISVYGISFHVVEVFGVLLIILRGYRWLKVDCRWWCWWRWLLRCSSHDGPLTVPTR